MSNVTGPLVHVGKAWKLLLLDLGLSPQNVLRLAGLPGGLLDGDGTRISVDQFLGFWESMASEVQDPQLALRLGQVSSVGLFDPAFFAAMCSPDMNTAAQRLGDFKRLTGPFRLDVAIRPDSTRIGFRCHGRAEIPHSMGRAELVFLVGFLRHATRHPIAPLAVAMPADREDARAYEDWFGCKISLGDGPAVTFTSQDALRPFLTHDDRMWEFFEPSLRRRTEDAPDKSLVSDRVEHALVELLPSGRAHIEDVARELALSKRSLQRRLSEEGTTWLDLLNGARERLACHYLLSTDLGVAEVSFLLGFENPNSLYRAFHRWTGTTPETWRSDNRTNIWARA